MKYIVGFVLLPASAAGFVAACAFCALIAGWHYGLKWLSRYAA